MDELHPPKPLGNLPHLELVLVSVPESAATGVLGVMADAVAVEPAVLVGDLSLEVLDVQRGVLAIDAGWAGTRLDFEGQRAPPEFLGREERPARKFSSVGPVCP